MELRLGTAASHYFIMRGIASKMSSQHLTPFCSTFTSHKAVLAPPEECAQLGSIHSCKNCHATVKPMPEIALVSNLPMGQKRTKVRAKDPHNCSFDAG
jgi:hypothetical protein